MTGTPTAAAIGRLRGERHTALKQTEGGHTAARLRGGRSRADDRRGEPWWMWRKSPLRRSELHRHGTGPIRDSCVTVSPGDASLASGGEEPHFAAVSGGVSEGPGRPDDADPAAGEYPGGVWVSSTPCPCSTVGVGGPGGAVSGVVGGSGDGDTGGLVAGVGRRRRGTAGCLGHRGGAAHGSDLLGGSHRSSSGPISAISRQTDGGHARQGVEQRPLSGLELVGGPELGRLVALGGELQPLARSRATVEFSPRCRP
ncbi:MAG: hypothetical protein K0R30_2788 [Ornithinibacter sp.]|nr:hypothetical protein [Ornithinibacter sp.]